MKSGHNLLSTNKVLFPLLLFFIQATLLPTHAKEAKPGSVHRWQHGMFAYGTDGGFLYLWLESPQKTPLGAIFSNQPPVSIELGEKADRLRFQMGKGEINLTTNQGLTVLHYGQGNKFSTKHLPLPKDVAALIEAYGQQTTKSGTPLLPWLGKQGWPALPQIDRKLPIFPFTKAAENFGNLNNPSDLEKLDRYGDTPLLAAVKRRQSELVEKLIAADANVEAKNRYDLTPLLVAIDNKDSKTVGILLRAGVSTKVVDKRKMTPLLHAVDNRDVDSVKLLLAAKADLEAKDRYENTPLLVAIDNKDPATLAVLLDAGANPNAVDRHSSTALVNAVDEVSSEMVRLLLEACANPNVKTHRKQLLADEVTSLYKATIQRQEELAAMVKMFNEIEKKAQWNRPK